MIEPILITEVSLPVGHPRAGERCPVFGFIVWHREGPVLVDTGVGRDHDAVERVFRPRHQPLEDALAHRGIEPGDVTMVINSHLHFDHCGNNRLFAGVPMVVQRTEYELATSPATPSQSGSLSQTIAGSSSLGRRGSCLESGSSRRPGTLPATSQW